MVTRPISIYNDRKEVNLMDVQEDSSDLVGVGVGFNRIRRITGY